ncbi:MAG: type II secretion system minor pseudopilin GspK [Deltaproteobacteria bacterium]|nr:type II secretion system minor pseudopilin GspK [Deltaproteobacteria bacterium]
MNNVRLGGEKGMVLLLVLVVVALLSALISEFAFSSLIDLRLAETYRDSTGAYHLARGGVRAARMILSNDTNTFDARSEMWGGGVANLPVGGGRISVTIEDLDGLLDINALVVGNNPQVEQKKRLQRLFANIGLEDPQNLVAALIDWLDSDDEVYYKDGAVGAESAYYLGLDPPYRAHNGRIGTMEELALVKGFTPEVVARIKPFVTLYGSMRINCNSAPAEVMATLYLNSDQPVSLDDAQSIVAARNKRPFRTVSDFIKVLPGLAALFPTGRRLSYSLKYTSDFYRIVSQAWINDGSRSVTAVVQKSKNRILFLKVD